jgi:acetone carboxylase gamma subunit
MEEEILKEIRGCCISDLSAEHAAKYAAEVAKRHIVEALDEAYDVMKNFNPSIERYEKWKVEYLKSKGIK